MSNETAGDDLANGRREPEPPGRPDASSSGGPADERAYVLAVDDQEANLTALEAALAGVGDGLVKARSGPEALRWLLDRDFAVVLLDVQMPGMDGFETAELIRARDRTRHTPILFLTAMNRTDEHALKGYSLGAVDYVFKPIAPEVLRAKVRVFLELHRRRRREAIAREELARSNQDLAQFAQVVAHDLQAPLRSVAGYLDLLARRAGGSLDETARHYVASAVADAERMKGQIRDLLAYARVKTEAPIPERTDTSAALAEALDRLRVPIAEGRAEVTQGPLPMVLADPSQITQLLQNLVDNAVKFRGPGAPRIHVSSERREQEWVFSVSDNGIGIDPKDRERIFGVFQRLHPRTEFAGTGIGLAICRKIVERHGGRIWVEAGAEKGSIFRFTLPRSSPAGALPRED